MVSEKIWVLVICLLFFWTDYCAAEEYTSITGMSFTIKKDSDGRTVGNVAGTDIFYQDAYCKNKNLFICVNLGLLKINVPQKSYLKDGFSWIGEFGEIHSVTMVPKLNILGIKIEDVFIVRQDWSNVKGTTHVGIFEVLFNNTNGIVAFKKQSTNSQLWITTTDKGYDPRNRIGQSR